MFLKFGTRSPFYIKPFPFLWLVRYVPQTLKRLIDIGTVIEFIFANKFT